MHSLVSLILSSIAIPLLFCMSNQTMQKDSTEASTEGSQQPLHDASNNAHQSISSTTTPVIPSSLLYEAKDAIFDSSTKLDTEHSAEGGANSNVYIDMGGMGSWVEFLVDHDAVVGASTAPAYCKLSFRYANGASNRRSRPCSVSVNGKIIGTLSFPSTIAWNSWSDEHIEAKECTTSGGKSAIIQLTATTEEGGPNIHSMEWSKTLSDDDSSTLSSTRFHLQSKEATTNRRKCNYRYNKLPEGQITYGLDDGGCFLCIHEHPIASKLTTKVPSSGNALTEQCQQLCDEDRQCLAFTVARLESLPPQLYRFGATANCCLERTMYPPGAFLRSPPTTSMEKKTNRGMPSNRRNDCQLDAMCWRRYEKIPEGDDEEPCAELLEEDVTVSHPSKLMCSRVWEATTYTDEDVQKAIDFINDGCHYQDSTYVSMLARANARCVAESLAESLAISIIVHSSGMMTYVAVGPST